MNTKKTGLLLVIVFLITLSYGREAFVLGNGWKFLKGHVEGAFMPSYDDSGWETVSVPHDWAVNEPFIADGDGNTGKLPWKGEAQKNSKRQHRI